MHKDSKGMIARLWRGTARPDAAAAYLRHLEEDTLPQLRRLDGFMGASVLQRPAAGGVEFVVITRWASMEAIRAFAGADPERAVVPEAAQRLMVSYDETVEHFELTVYAGASEGAHLSKSIGRTSRK